VNDFISCSSTLVVVGFFQNHSKLHYSFAEAYYNLADIRGYFFGEVLHKIGFWLLLLYGEPNMFDCERGLERSNEVFKASGDI
jgi:hypothetical protein